MTDYSDPEQVPVAVALARVMRDVRVIAKDDQTSATGRYMYRGVDRVTNEVGPILRKHGVLCIPELLSLEHRDITTATDKTQHEVIVNVGYTFYGPMGDTIHGTAPGESADSADKATPQAMSVAFRTFLLQAMTIPTGDKDPDENDVERSAPAVDHKALGWENPGDQARVWGECLDLQKTVRAGDHRKAILAWGKAEGLDPSTLTADQGAAWFRRLTEAIAAQEVPADDPNAGPGTEAF